MPKIKSLVLDFSTISEFRLCPRRGHLLGLTGHKSPGYTPHPNTRIGKTLHSCFEQLYQATPIHLSYAQVEALAADNQLTDRETQQRIWGLYQNYVDKYFVDGADIEFSPVKSESLMTHQLIENIHYRGTVDLIAKLKSYDNELAIIDHKCSSSPGTYVIPKLETTEQLTGYAWLAYKQHGLAISRVGYNCVDLRTGKFDRIYAQRTASQFDSFVRNISYWGLQIRAWLESGNVPTDCDHGLINYGSICPLKSYCTSDATSRQEILETMPVDRWHGCEVEWEK